MLNEMIADLQPNRTHPADFENPGRVKVQFQKDGKFLNPIIKNRTSSVLFHILPHSSTSLQHHTPPLRMSGTQSVADK